jgi:hypothetical protein
MPQDLEFIDLDAGCIMQHMTDLNDKPAYILSDASWCALCNQERVLAYIHAAGLICLPDEVVSLFILHCDSIHDSESTDPICESRPESFELCFLASSLRVKVAYAIL